MLKLPTCSTLPKYRLGTHGTLNLQWMMQKQQMTGLSIPAGGSAGMAHQYLCLDSPSCLGYCSSQNLIFKLCLQSHWLLDSLSSSSFKWEPFSLLATKKPHHDTKQNKTTEQAGLAVNNRLGSNPGSANCCVTSGKLCSLSEHLLKNNIDGP